MKSDANLRTKVPIGLLILLVLNFGLLIPRLGFYWDDWPVILTGQLQGAQGFQEFYQYDRPFSAWTYILTYPVLGNQPIAWHIFTLLLRWGTSVALWWTLERLWPLHKREAAWAAALFAVYPVFLQQSISVAYSQHWICYCLFFLSLAGMLEAQSRRAAGSRWYWPLTAVAMISALLDLLTMEYFAGLELIRPVLLWFLFAGSGLPWIKRVRKALRAWLPYLLVLVGFALWRFFFLKFPGQEANPPILLRNILSDPVRGIPRFVEIALQDTLHLLVSVWTNILSPEEIDLANRFNLFSWAWVILIAGIAIFFLRRIREPSHVQETTGLRWSRQALITGIVAILLGMLPVWATDRQIIVGMYSNRFGLPAMLGTSLVFVALLEELIAHKMQRIVILSLLLGLAAGQHLRTANDYRWSWVRQTRFYWNLAWRAPGLEPNTTIAAEGEIFPYVGLYSTTAGINLSYLPTNQGNQLLYWFSSLGREYEFMIDDFIQGVPLITRFRHYTFTGQSKDILVVYYNPAENDCLEILSPDDFNAPGLPGVSAAALANSDLTRILPESTPGYPSTTIFGAEPEQGWCYLYEKAALAQQYEQWNVITGLGNLAQEQGYDPRQPDSDTAFEWLPFIEGYARNGDWEQAINLSRQAYQEDERINGRMCDLWKDLEATGPQGALSAAQVRQELGCP